MKIVIACLLSVITGAVVLSTVELWRIRMNLYTVDNLVERMDEIENVQVKTRDRLSRHIRYHK